MGEIGIPRREFLYDLRFWEVRRIVRGYRRRDRLKHQLLAECVYASMYCMRDAQGKTVESLFPSLFKDDDAEEVPEMSADDFKDMQELIAAENRRLGAK